jgi:hypothetical protein
LAPHHGYILKKVAGVAMNAVKKKEKFFSGIIEQQSNVQGIKYTEEMVYEDVKEL